RMSAISPNISPEDVMPALAHNVTLNGYAAGHGGESLEPTEFLKLVIRYLVQARELEKLAGPDKVLQVATCESPVTGDLLRILGYRMRGGCGSDLALETVNPSRAFLTIDSGFPLSELEAALRTNRAFTLDYHPARVPIFYTADYWQPGARKRSNSSITFSTSRQSAAYIRQLRRWIPKPRYRCARICPSPKRKSTRTCWTFSAPCSNCGMVRQWYPEAPGPRKRGPIWWA